MAETIKEMAEKNYPFRWPGGNPTWADKIRMEAYIEGANAVLEEIESIIVNNEDNTLCMARCLVYKIKELKGE